MKNQAEFQAAAKEVSLLWMAAISEAGNMAGSAAASAMLAGVLSQTIFRIEDGTWKRMTDPFNGPIPDDCPPPVPPLMKALIEFRRANEVLRAELQLAGKIPFPKPPTKEQ